MERLVVLVRERDWENEKWYDYYAVSNEIADPEASFRAAIAEFLSTEEGIQAIKDSSEDFNWGDAVLYVPSDIWLKHGIREIGSEDTFTRGLPVEIEVVQDEVLIPESYFEREA